MSQHSFADQQDTRRWIKSFTSELTRPCVVLLSGELGAGKTQVVRWFLEELGAQNISSPTFAIHNEYQVTDGHVDHVDLYRVTSDDDLEASGFWDLFTQERGLVFVEWADRLPRQVWPEHWTQIYVDLHKVEGALGRTMELEIKRP